MFHIVITDLDGTLLDQETYDFSPAAAALSQLRRRHIPLVLCSSKTASEMVHLRQEIGNTDPFIVENGGGIYIPKNYFSSPTLEGREDGEFLVIAMGRDYPELQQILEEISVKQQLKICSFHHMTPSDLAAESGLSLAEAGRALQREFDLPFRMLSGYDSARLENEVSQRNLHLTRGGRFFHLSGDHDKGRATQKLASLYQQDSGESVRSVGLGDSENDLSMLGQVTVPIIVPNHKSLSPLLLDRLPQARQAPTAGPEGWNSAILSLLDDATITNSWP